MEIRSRFSNPITPSESIPLIRDYFFEVQRLMENPFDAEYTRFQEIIKELMDINVYINSRTVPLYSIFARILASEGISEPLFLACAIHPGITDYQDGNGRAPIHWAAYQGQLDTVNRMIDSGSVDYTLKTKEGYNLFHVIAISPYVKKFCHNDTIRGKTKDFIGKIDKLNIFKIKEKEKEKNEPIEVWEFDKEDVTYTLMELKEATEEKISKLNYKRKSNKEKEKLTTKENEEKYVNWDAFADEGSLDDFRTHYTRLVKCLIKRLSFILNINERDSRGQTPLMIAHRIDNEFLIRYLKANGATEENGEKDSILLQIGEEMKKKLTMKSEKEEFSVRIREIIDCEKLLNKGPMIKKIKFPLVKKPKGEKYRILSMDGGGIRCICHPVILAKIVEKYPKFIESIDLICGCSGSSMISCALSLGFTLNQIAKIVHLSAEYTLSKKEGNQLFGFLYSSKWNRMLCDLLFGEIRLRDLNIPVCIPSYLLDNGKTGNDRMGDSCFYSTIRNNVSQNDNVRCADVCLRSGAAPTYFRTYQGHVDGGIFANNPSTCGIVTATCDKEKEGEIDKKDVVCLSIGTGFSCCPYFNNENLVKEGGIAQWNVQLIDLYDLSQRFFIDNINVNLIGERYFRFMPPVKDIKLDNLAQLKEMEAMCEKIDINPILDWIGKYWFD